MSLGRVYRVNTIRDLKGFKENIDMGKFAEGSIN